MYALCTSIATKLKVHWNFKRQSKNPLYFIKQLFTRCQRVISFKVPYTGCKFRETFEDLTRSSILHVCDELQVIFLDFWNLMERCLLRLTREHDVYNKIHSGLLEWGSCFNSSRHTL